ncbi:MAG TPA: serpin family protein [Jiangellaceae bacterium]|nr:serpin family protein [Jiangellaceae bacterium]
MDHRHLEFVANLHRELPAAGNLPWSPYSVASALGIAASGARGATRDELVRALVPGGDLDELARLLARAAQLSKAEVGIANTLWMRHGTPFREEFQQTVRNWPGGAVETADFRSDAEGSRQKINNTVEQDTRGLVRDLLAPGTIHAETGAVIVNALYLKVAWQAPFVEADTRPAAFHASSGTREVPTMRQQSSLRYGAAGGWRLVTLPTVSDVVVDVLLADDERAPLGAATVAELHSASRDTKVDLALPRFRIESEMELNRPLAGVGVRAAFSPRLADFSGISPEPMFIETAVHKAVLDVDEQGFEGAAATALAMRLVSIDLSRPVPFHVDRPFIVLVRNRRTGAVYFLARVEEP